MKLSNLYYEAINRRDNCYVYEIDTPGGQNLIIRPHWHEELELIYCLCNGNAELDGEHIVFCRDDIIVVNKEVLHSLSYSEKGKCYAILVDYEYLAFRHNDICQDNIITPLASGALRIQNHIKKGTPLHNDIIQPIRFIAGSKDGSITSRLTVKSLLYNILCSFHTNNVLFSNDKNAQSNNAVDYVKKVISFIENNYQNELNIDTMAKHVNISRNYLFKLFRQMTQMSPVEYLNNYRLEKAKYMLEGGMNVNETSYAVGFNSPSYFIKLYKDKYKNTPGSQAHK